MGTDPGGLSRRRFLRLAAMGAAAAASGGVPFLLSCGDSTSPGGGGSGRSPLLTPQSLGISDASFAAAPGVAVIGPDESAPAWLFNGVLPGPTLRGRHGERAQIRLLNQLTEPTIVHWHGVLVPPEADGHPRFAVEPGGTYDYDFPIAQRAGTFWYHPHPHHRTAGQIHRGLAGFFLVSDQEEDSLGLPSGERETLLLLQDRDGETELAFDNAPTDDDLHVGMLRDVPFGNGIANLRSELSVRLRCSAPKASRSAWASPSTGPGGIPSRAAGRHEPAAELPVLRRRRGRARRPMGLSDHHQPVALPRLQLVLRGAARRLR